MLAATDMETLLFTGASGFWGRNIIDHLRSEYDVTTLGLNAADDVMSDLALEVPVLPQHFDIVLHAAAKVHIEPKTSEEERQFYEVNFEGTKHLCSALEHMGVPKSMIFISSVAVYGCDKGDLVTEAHPCAGMTPYAKSKILAEDFLTQWCRSHDVVLTILRPPLLVGKKPPGSLGEVIKGIEKGFYVNIAGGKTLRSVLMADDIANLLPLTKDIGGVYNVCDTDCVTFAQLSMLISKQLGRRKPLSIPYGIAKCLAVAGDCLGKKAPINSRRLTKLTNSLTFSNAKATTELGWKPLNVVENLKIR